MSFVALAALLVVVFPLWGIIDALRTPRHAWLASGQSRTVWALVQIVFSFVGATAYVAIARPRLQRAVQGLR